MQNLKTEKLLEAFITKIENDSDRNSRNCPVLRANLKLLSKLKSENSRQILEDIGFITDIDTSSCKDCDASLL